MKKYLPTMLALVLLLGATKPLAAQNETKPDAMKPVLTVSFCGYDELINNIGMFGRLGGNPDIGQGVDFMLQMVTQGKGLAGVDKTQPWGGALMADNQGELKFYCFIPVNKLEQLVETAQAMQVAQKVELDKGVYEIQAGEQTIYAQQKGKWAFICLDKETLSHVTADPVKLLGDLPKKYDLAFRASAKNVPQSLRDQYLAIVKMGFETGMAQTPDETDEQYEFRTNAAKQSLQQIITLLNESDEALLGLNIDPSTNACYLDFELTAREGTKLADQMASMKPGKSHFAGFFMPEAALTANSIGAMTDADVANAKSSLASARQPLLKWLDDQNVSGEAVTKLIDAVLDCINKTVETKKSDNGMAILLDPNAVTMIAGTAIAGGDKLEKAVLDYIGELEKSDAEAAKLFKLNAETYQGVRFHKFAMPLPDPKLEAMLGDQFDVVLGIADNRLYFAAGKDAAKSLKKAMDRSKSLEGKEVPPTRISLSAVSIAKFAAEVAPDPQAQMVASIFSATLAEADGKDHLLLTATPIKRGFRMRLELEEGLLKAISTMGSQMGGMAPGM